MFHINLNNLLQSVVYNYNGTPIELDVLRLDQMHDEINGNKWFKLKYLLEEAIQNDAKQIITFGGVWSNHIIATAAACALFKLPCKAYIRSDEHLQTATLENAKAYGMEIEYCTREKYKQIKKSIGLDENGNYYIPEGGASALGIKGAMEILNINNLHQYTHIICSIGTGTTFAGIVNASLSHQKIIGINALKGGFSQIKDVEPFLHQNNFEVYNDFHFGGFAKYNEELIQSMNSFYEQTKIPLDIVYTGKMFDAIGKLYEEKIFTNNDKLLVIHTGGLQGNKSLTKDILIY